MKKLLVLAWAAGVGFSASALNAASISDDGTLCVGSNTTDFSILGAGGGVSKPDKKPGGSSETIALTGVRTFDCVTNTLSGETIESTTTNQNVILASNWALLTVTNCTLNKSGDTSSEDASNFYALNAVVAAKTNATIRIDHSTLNSNAEGANCLFASGSGSTIYAYDCTLTSTKDSSRGLDATYKGTVIASKMTINTEGAHCAALATDKEKGYISATDSRFSTAGDGSPLIYSTGTIEANGVTGTATGAQIACIEGLSKIRIRNSNLSSTSDKTGGGKPGYESVPNGAMIYQSNSGDSEEGTATFEVSDSTLKSAITNGTMFYITNTKADIRVRNTVLDFDTEMNYLLKAAGNNCGKGWGNAGSNGAEVVFTAIDQELVGNITVDGISSLDMFLTNSTFTGAFENDTRYTGNGDGIELFISADSTWVVTSNCTLKSLMAAPGAKVLDGSGNTVSIFGTNGTAYVNGEGDWKVSVSSYAQGDVAITNAITTFEIDRSDFEAMYGEGEEKGEGGKGGVSGTYYFKPHAPENAILKVKIKGVDTLLKPDMDHKYWLDDYWDEKNGVTVELIYDTQTGYFFIDGSGVITQELTIVTNKTEIDPPACTATVRAQANSGSTYYLTLKEAIEKASGGGKGGSEISLNDNVTLEETITVTNSIKLDCSTNSITMGSALATAFHFTGGKSTKLSDLTMHGDGCLLYIDDNAKVTLTNNCAFTCDNAASVYCTTKGKLVIAEGTYKDDGVVIAAPDGYLWENGILVAGTPPEEIAAGEWSEPHADALAATNAAAQINANKANSIAVPTGVEGAAKMTYLTKVMATATGDNRVAIDLTPTAREEEQTIVNDAVTNETTVAALTSTDVTAKATIATTTPGLYYWIQGGTEVNAVTESGTGVLSTDGGSVELTKPTLDASKGKAFFKIAAGVSAPHSVE